MGRRSTTTARSTGRIATRPRTRAAAGPAEAVAMPYLRCPSCGLLAHATSSDHTTPIHCPRCRAAQRHSQLRPLEHSLQPLTAPPEQHPKPAATSPKGNPNT